MKEYKLLQTTKRSRLIEMINEHLNDGWELYGDTETERHWHYTLYMQNMVLPNVEEHYREKAKVEDTLHRLWTNSNAQLGRMQLSLARAEKFEGER